jgi:hypothetical protein
MIPDFIVLFALPVKNTNMPTTANIPIAIHKGNI